MQQRNEQKVSMRPTVGGAGELNISTSTAKDHNNSLAPTPRGGVSPTSNATSRRSSKLLMKAGGGGVLPPRAANRLVPSSNASTPVTKALYPSEQRSGEEVYIEFGGIDRANAMEALTELGINLYPEELVTEFFETQIPPKTKFLSRRQFLALLIRSKKYYQELEKAMDAAPAFSPAAIEQSGGEEGATPLPPRVTTPANVEDREAIVAFAAIGGNMDQSGFIEQDQLARLCDDFGLGIDIDDFMAEVDEDGSGQIEYNEFIQLLAYDGAGPEVSANFQICGASLMVPNDKKRKGLAASTVGGRSSSPASNPDAQLMMPMREFLSLIPVPNSILIRLAIEQDEYLTVAGFSDICTLLGKSSRELALMAQTVLEERREEEEESMIINEGTMKMTMTGRLETPALDSNYARRMNRRVDRVVDSYHQGHTSRHQKMKEDMKKEGLNTKKKPRPPSAGGNGNKRPPIAGLVSPLQPVMLARPSSGHRPQSGRTPRTTTSYHSQPRPGREGITREPQQSNTNQRAPTRPSSASIGVLAPKRRPTARERMLLSFQAKEQGDKFDWRTVPVERTNRPLNHHSPLVEKTRPLPPPTSPYEDEYLPSQRDGVLSPSLMSDSHPATHRPSASHDPVPWTPSRNDDSLLVRSGSDIGFHKTVNPKTSAALKIQGLFRRWRNRRKLLASALLREVGRGYLARSAMYQLRVKHAEYTLRKVGRGFLARSKLGEEYQVQQSMLAVDQFLEANTMLPNIFKRNHLKKQKILDEERARQQQRQEESYGSSSGKPLGPFGLPVGGGGSEGSSGQHDSSLSGGGGASHLGSSSPRADEVVPNRAYQDEEILSETENSVNNKSGGDAPRSASGSSSRRKNSVVKLQSPTSGSLGASRSGRSNSLSSLSGTSHASNGPKTGLLGLLAQPELDSTGSSAKEDLPPLGPSNNSGTAGPPSDLPTITQRSPSVASGTNTAGLPADGAASQRRRESESVAGWSFRDSRGDDKVLVPGTAVLNRQQSSSSSGVVSGDNQEREKIEKPTIAAMRQHQQRQPSAANPNLGHSFTGTPSEAGTSVSMATTTSTLNVPGRRKKKKRLFKGSSANSRSERSGSVTSLSETANTPRHMAALSGATQSLLDPDIIAGLQQQEQQQQNPPPPQHQPMTESLTGASSSQLVVERSPPPASPTGPVPRSRLDLVAIDVAIPASVTDGGTAVLLEEESFIVVRYPASEEVFRTILTNSQYQWARGSALFTVPLPPLPSENNGVSPPSSPTRPPSGMSFDVSFVFTTDGTTLREWRAVGTLGLKSLRKQQQQQNSSTDDTTGMHYIDLFEISLHSSGRGGSIAGQACGQLQLKSRALAKQPTALATKPQPTFFPAPESQPAAPSKQISSHSLTSVGDEKPGNTSCDSAKPLSSDCESTPTGTPAERSTAPQAAVGVDADDEEGFILLKKVQSAHALQRVQDDVAVLPEKEHQVRSYHENEETKLWDEIMEEERKERQEAEIATIKNRDLSEASIKAGEHVSKNAREKLRPLYDRYFLFGGDGAGMGFANTPGAGSNNDRNSNSGSFSFLPTTVADKSLARFLSDFQGEMDDERNRVLKAFNRTGSNQSSPERVPLHRSGSRTGSRPSSARSRRSDSQDGGGTAAGLGLQTLNDATTGKQLSYDEFCAFLFNPSFNSMLDPQTEKVNMSTMNFPLHHYYINSSHNTYLTGNQFSSSSSTNMYREVLKLGCRCVEIDCWDGPKGEPIVYHGYTKTSKIKFRDVIDAISETAFASSPFPVILSLENHCSPKQCATMAAIMKETFGSLLYSLSDLEKDEYETWTPAKLKYKILVKWKVHRDAADDEKVSLNEDGDVVEPANQEVSSSPTNSGNDNSSISKKKEDKLLVEQLCSTVVVEAIKTKDWGLTSQGYHCQSINEGTMYKWQENPEQSNNFKTVTSRMFIRTYPAGWRVGSANYAPLAPWIHGAQLVALNFQTRDHFFALNSAMFSQNGNCGYVLKPLALREPGLNIPPCSARLELTIVAGSGFVPLQKRKESDVTVSVVLHSGRVQDMEANASNGEMVTHTVEKDAYSPFWNCRFSLRLSSLKHSFLSFTVKGKSSFFGDTILATKTVAVGQCRPGLRCLSMDKGPVSEADHPTLLCQLALFSEGDVKSVPRGNKLSGSASYSSRLDLESKSFAKIEEEFESDQGFDQNMRPDQSICRQVTGKDVKKKPVENTLQEEEADDEGERLDGSTGRGKNLSRTSSRNSYRRSGSRAGSARGGGTLGRRSPGSTSMNRALASSVSSVSTSHTQVVIPVFTPIEPYSEQAHLAALVLQKWTRGCQGRMMANERWAEAWAAEVYRQMEEEAEMMEEDMMLAAEAEQGQEEEEITGAPTPEFHEY